MRSLRRNTGIATLSGFLIVFLAFAAFAAEPVKPVVPKGSPAAGPPFAPRVPAAGAPVAPGVPIPQGPRIVSFAGPDRFVPGETFRLSWQVEPGVAGSPVSVVGIYQGDAVVSSPLPPTGTHEIRPVSYPVGASSLGYTLKARDASGKVSSRIVNVGILSAQHALRQLEIGLQADPREFRARMPIELKVTMGSTHWPMSGMEIRVKHGERTVGRLTGYAIRGPVNIAVLRDDGFPGTSGEYIVEIEYMRQVRERRFATYGVPYYSLIPTSR
ncbi:MAG: hypothetical protein C4529_12935 [Deltaproteobacteria bacterium]|nr:MAG: hypothetical protein C4529_12935 [Deltaproteobacteria bacterium]